MNDICFVGNAFPNRIEFFNRLVPFLAHKKVIIVGALWNQLKQYRLLAKQIHLNWMPIEETIKYYNGAKIVVNLHRGAQEQQYNHNSAGIPGCSTNPRTFEINSCCAFQLTDVRDDLKNLYSAGVDLETYDSPLEFIRKAEYYLGHDKERSQIAYRGYNRTLKDHTFQQRIHQLLIRTQNF
jgi:spore maturation protein CgeB